MRYIYIYIFHTICVAGVWAGYSTRHQIQRSRTPTTTTTTKKTDSVGYWGSYTKLLAAVRSIIINGGRLCVPCNMLQPRTHLQTSAHMKQARFGGPQRHGTSSLAPHLTPSSAAAAARCHLAVNAGGIWANWARVDQVPFNHLTRVMCGRLTWVDEVCIYRAAHGVKRIALLATCDWSPSWEFWQLS